MLVLLNIQLESVTGAADHRVVGFKLKQAFLGETQDLISTDDAVVDQSHIELPEHFFEAARDEFVRVGRLGHKTWMTMHRDDRGGVISEDRPSHLTRMHGCALNVSVKELLVPEVAIARVQEYETEHFAVQHSIVQCQP